MDKTEKNIVNEVKGLVNRGIDRVAASLADIMARIPQHEVLKARVIATPDRMYMVDIPHNKKETYGEFWSRCKRLANVLTDLGIKKGDHVSTFSDDCIEMVEMIYACTMTGTIYTVVNSRYVGHEAEYIIDHSDSKVVFSGPGRFAETINSIRSNLKKVEHYISWGDTQKDMLNYEELLSKASDEEPKVKVSSSDFNALTYTSGTTGRPAGSLRRQRSHTNWELAMFMGWITGPGGIIRRPELLPRLLSAIRAGLKAMVFYPFFHWGGIVALPMMPLLGATYYMGSGLVKDTKTVLETVEKEKINLFACVPTIAVRIANYPDVDKYDLSSIVAYQNSGGAVDVRTRMRMKELLPNAFHYELYSSTEAIFSGANIEAIGLESRGSGVQLPGTTLKVFDEEGKEVPRGTWGKIYVKAKDAGVHDGYYKDEDRTKRSKMIIDGEEWFTSEDVGYLDEEDGNLYIADRSKDVINTGGELVGSLEVESILSQHPKIAEVAVIGIPDPEYQERVTAVVVLKPGETATSEEIMDWCRDKMAGFKRPRRVDFVDELPIVGADKVDKKVIREWYWKEEKLKV